MKFRLNLITGFTLMELIGVMAVMAIMAGALAPSLFDSIDRAYADAEQQNLEALNNSLENYITEFKQIPTATPSSWVTALSAVSDFTQQEIEFNQKNFRRRFIFDPRFFTASDSNFNGFTQNQGLANAPVSPRIMLVSDLTRHVPTVANTSGVFNSIWDQTGTPALIEDQNLKISRINLSDKFHRVILGNQHTNQPFYQLESGAQTTIPAASGGLDGLLTRYVFSNTQLNLFVDPFPSGGRAQVATVHNDLSMRYQTDGFNWSWVKQ